MTAQDKDFEREEALVLLDAWGSGESIDSEPFQGHAYVIRDYHPEWVPVPKDRTGVVTLLSICVGTLSTFEGYSVLEHYPAGERECPYLSEPSHVTSGCDLCKGDNYIYWGEEWQVVVLLEDESADEDEEDDDAIDTSEVPELDESFFEEAVLTRPGEDVIHKVRAAREGKE